MKYVITVDGVIPSITLTAESKADTIEVFELATKHAHATTTVPVAHKVTHKKHKKHVFTKTCDLCGRKCKGSIGLSLHACPEKKKISPERCDICNKDYAMPRGLAIHKSSVHGIKSTKPKYIPVAKRATTTSTGFVGWLTNEPKQNGDITIMQ
jgi:hypothetical protein